MFSTISSSVTTPAAPPVQHFLITAACGGPAFILPVTEAPPQKPLKDRTTEQQDPDFFPSTDQKRLVLLFQGCSFDLLFKNVTAERNDVLFDQESNRQRSSDHYLPEAQMISASSHLSEHVQNAALIIKYFISSFASLQPRV